MRLYTWAYTVYSALRGIIEAEPSELKVTCVACSSVNTGGQWSGVGRGNARSCLSLVNACVRACVVSATDVAYNAATQRRQAGTAYSQLGPKPKIVFKK